VRQLSAGLLLLLLAGCRLDGDSNSAGETLSGIPNPTIPSLPDLDPREIALGETIYATHCAECHGANLEGEDNWRVQNEDGSFRSPPHDATGHTWHHSDKLLFEAIKLGGQRYSASIGGASPMPAFEDVLTDVEITAVLAYIKSHWPEDIRQTQWQVSVFDNQ